MHTSDRTPTRPRRLTAPVSSDARAGDHLQYVILEEGTYHGQLALAPPQPGTLRLGVSNGNETWTELYVYVVGRTETHPDHGPIPVMVFVQRDTG